MIERLHDEDHLEEEIESTDDEDASSEGDNLFGNANFDLKRESS